MQRITINKTILGLSLILFVAACTPNSDAVSILGTQNTSLQATVTAFQSYGPTMTANALMATRVQSTLAAVVAQNKELTQKLNAQAPQPTIPVAARGAVMDSATPGASASSSTGAQSTPVSSTNGLSFTDVSTAKSIDGSGCALNTSTTFMSTDPKIYVVANVRNLKKGTAFTAKWSGPDFSREDKWTANANRQQLCIYFYIEPRTLGLNGGDFTVTLSATGLNSSPLSFTLQQSAQPANQGQQQNQNKSDDTAMPK